MVVESNPEPDYLWIQKLAPKFLSLSPPESAARCCCLYTPLGTTSTEKITQLYFAGISQINAQYIYIDKSSVK